MTNEHDEEISACMTPLKDSRRSQRAVGRLKGTKCVTRKVLKQQSRSFHFSHGVADARLGATAGIRKKIHESADPFAAITWCYSTRSLKLYHSDRITCTGEFSLVPDRHQRMLADTHNLETKQDT